MNSHLTAIKKSVSFIFIREKDNFRAIGTGFFVGIVHEQNDKIMTSYFVTAKHVLRDHTGQLYQAIYIRLNLKDGDSELIQINTQTLEIFEHEEPEVDIMLFVCLPNQDVFDFLCLAKDLLSTKEIIAEHKIGEGINVFFAGLFTAYLGQKKNQPILRFGKVALMPDEKIEWMEKGKPSKYMELYLLECHSFGGNSGSPVFFQLDDPTRTDGIIRFDKNIFLAGIMTGCYSIFDEIQTLTKTDTTLISQQNMGIAAITPCKKLHDILFSEKLVKKRLEDGIGK